MHGLERIWKENGETQEGAAEAAKPVVRCPYKAHEESLHLDALQAAVTIALAAALEPIDRLLREARAKRG